MATVADLAGLGYVVGVAFTGEDGVAVWSVGGFGVQTYVAENDAAQIDSLANPEAIAAFENPPTPMPPTPPAPSAADTVLAALSDLDPATASVADVVNAVKSALQQAGATPAA